MKDKDFEKLAAELQSLKKTGLSESKRGKMKERLFYKMDIFSASRFSLDGVNRARLRERTMEVLSTRTQKNRFAFMDFFGNVFSGARVQVAVSVMTVFALVFGIFGFMRMDSDVVRAATLTFLKHYEGEVFVERNEEILDVYEGMYLLEDDIVYTSEGGRAVIEYFDNSVSRLSEETKIVLNKLEEPENSMKDGEIEVLVLSGVVWYKILSFIEAESLFSVKAKDVYASTDRASFNLKVDEDDLEIEVFGNVLNIRDDEMIEELITGEKLLVSNGDVRQREVRDSSDIESENEWVKKNLAYDKEYLSEVESRLLIARAEAVGINPDDEITFERSLKDNALMFFTFDDVKAKKRELDLAERDFIAAQIKLRYNDLSEEELEEINYVIEGFDEAVRSFNDFADRVAYTDDEYADELKAYVSDKVTVNKIDLEPVMPDSPVYVARDVVEDLELILSEDSSEDVDAEFEQAVDRLVAVDDVFYERDEFWDSDLAAEYTEVVTRVLSLLEDMNFEDEGAFEDAKQLLAGKLRDDVKVLEDMDFVSEDDVSEFEEVVDVAPVVYEEEEEYFEDDVSISSDELADFEDEVEEEERSDVFVEGPYGVKVRGDKPLGPMLE